MRRLMPILAVLVVATSSLSAQSYTKWRPALEVAVTSGTVAAGTHSVTFIMSSDFVGTIMGTAVTGAAPGGALSFSCQNEHTHPAIDYTRAAGTLWILTER